MRYILWLSSVLNRRSRAFADWHRIFSVYGLASIYIRDSLNLRQARETVYRVCSGIDVENARRYGSIRRGRYVGRNRECPWKFRDRILLIARNYRLAVSSGTGQELLRPIQLSLRPRRKSLYRTYTRGMCSHTYTPGIVTSSSSHVILDFSL